MSITPCDVIVKAQVQAWSAQCTSFAGRQMMLRMACAMSLMILTFLAMILMIGSQHRLPR